jgi:tetratricopeptide (TPR) repeat protein
MSPLCCIRVARVSASWTIVAILAACFAVPASGQAPEDEVTPQVQSLYAEAQGAQRKGDETGAIGKYKMILKLAPHLAPAYNNLGALYYDQHDYAQAIHTLERGLQLDPTMTSASAVLGMSYVKMGQSDRAKPPLTLALQANPNDNNAQMALAHALINMREYEDAAQQLRLYLARNPKDQQALYLIGKTYLQLSETSLAKIKDIDPDSVTAHEVTGEIDESMGNYDGALVEYKKAVELAPHEPGTHFHLGNTFWAISKWDSASLEFKAELENDPRSCLALWKLGNATLEIGESPEAALTSLNKAVEYCPSLVQARVDRARAQIKLGQTTEALPDLLAAEKENPDEPSIHFLLASVYKAQGKAATAQQELQTYARLRQEATASVAARANKSISIKSESH